MTFTNIVTEITGRLNYNSSDATTRIGKAVNRVYRRVTTAIGMITSRRVQVSANKSLGSAEVTFTGIEKIERVFDDTSGSVVILRQVTYDELRSVDAGTGDPTAYAIKTIGPDSVTIRLDVLAQDTDALKADGHSSVSDLSGSDEPAFPESFHDVLIEGVLAEELRKQEKPALAKMAQEAHDRTLSDLKFFIAKSGYLQNKQNKLQQGASQGSASGGGSAPSGGTSYTQTGLITFDRDPSAPFAVSASSAKVDNLDADKLDGLDSTAFALDADFDAHVADVANPHAVTKTQVGLGNVPNTDATNADNLSSGTIPDARFPATLPAVSGANLTNLDASDLASGTIPDARFPATLPAVSGANLTNLDANDLASGKVPDARLNGITTDGASKVQQIAFHATQSASSDANTLDDYEEGSWTPTLTGSGGQSGQAYTRQVGRYVKVGKLVTLWGRLTMSTLGTVTGSAQIGGLPFTAENVTDLYGDCHINFWNSLTSSFVMFAGQIVANTTVITLTKTTAAATGVGTVAQGDLSNTTDIIFQATYRATD